MHSNTERLGLFCPTSTSVVPLWAYYEAMFPPRLYIVDNDKDNGRDRTLSLTGIHLSKQKCGDHKINWKDIKRSSFIIQTKYIETTEISFSSNLIDSKLSYKNRTGSRNFHVTKAISCPKSKLRTKIKLKERKAQNPVWWNTKRST